MYKKGRSNLSVLVKKTKEFQSNTCCNRVFLRFQPSFSAPRFSAFFFAIDSFIDQRYTFACIPRRKTLETP